MSSEYSSLIINASSGIAALKKLLVLRKAEDRKVTLSWISRRLKIKSSSYLSEALNGKKVLKADYIDELVSLTKVGVTEGRLLKARILAESRSTKEHLKEKYQREVELLRKQLQARQMHVPDVGKFHFSALILVSFYLFAGRQAKREQLIHLFGRERYEEVDRALLELTQLEAIAKDGDTYRLLKDPAGGDMIFAAGDAPGEKEFIRHGFVEGLHELDRQYEDADHSCFFSSVTTVDLAIYRRILENFRSQMRTFIADLDTQTPDSVIRINIQMYPVLKK